MKSVKIYKYINEDLDEKLIAEFETDAYDGDLEIPDDVILSYVPDVEDIPEETVSDGDFNDYNIYAKFQDELPKFRVTIAVNN
jgi:hypothetical protein